ncbi:glutathione S-transferase U9-like [Coffea eugenioides]|uniref:Glutathione S-transferase n=1 Tax=Coffea arabica TaxID=13443 RepID=A0A6P6XFL8_COFAR|nr:glutathione S-transferase U9-like [Coffea arabica]XP_027169801.1 glutathione S-transferase U9-like [Coffea eugenioides]
MGSGENKVVLHGMWASPYVKRVELALKIKGIPFEYVEENLRNKSPQLLKYNPVHKKVPVLVHNGKPVCESLVILEYLDEVWSTGPQLLPKEPYQRANFRFWAAYIQQLLESIFKLFNADKEAHEKPLQEVHEKLRNLEDGVKEFYFPEGSPNHISAENLGILDVMLVSVLGPFRAKEEAFSVKILDPEKNPLIFSWIQALIELPLVKEVVPPHDKMVGVLQFLKQSGFKF